MSYHFKIRAETIWFVAVAVLTVLMTALVQFDPDKIADWRAWAIGLGAACVRAAAGAVLALLAPKPGAVDETEPKP